MNSNWFKLVMRMTKVEYGKNLLLKGVPIISVSYTHLTLPTNSRV